jgi:hypothetical protein
MTPEIDTPLGAMLCNQNDDENRFLSCDLKIHGESVYTNVAVESFDVLDQATFAFAKTIIAEFDEHTKRAGEYLLHCYEREPAQLGGECEISIPVVRFPEMTFWGGEKWSILFTYGVFPICQPYGILINFLGVEITGFEDISGADEV